MHSTARSALVHRRSQRGISVSDSSAGSGIQNIAHQFRCDCGLNVTLYISRTSMNPNRPFFGCPKYQENKPYCKYFKWLDEAVAEMGEVPEMRRKMQSDLGGNVEFSSQMGEVHEMRRKMQSELTRNVEFSSQMGEGVHEVQRKMQTEISRIDNEIMCLKIGFGVMGVVIFVVIIFVVVTCVIR